MEALLILFAVLLIDMALFGGFGAWIASQKGRDAIEGFVIGTLFGPLGVLVCVLLPTPAPAARRASPGSDAPRARRPLGREVMPEYDPDWDPDWESKVRATAPPRVRRDDEDAAFGFLTGE